MAAMQARHEALDHLLNLEERVRLSGATLPKVVDTRERMAGLRCSVAQSNCILPLDDVAEVLENRLLENRTLTQIPGCADWVKGVVNLRGRLLPVFGVSEYFAIADNSAGAYQVVVVDRGPVFCGLAVSRILGMRKFYKDIFSDFVPGETPLAAAELSEFVESVAVIDECSWYQLNIEELARRIMHSNPAAALRANTGT